MPSCELEDTISVNLLGPMRCVRQFLPQMIARRSGSIVNVASIAGRIVITPNGVYSAAKHALVA
jgi:NAD(P)-dependent dehydrogenase (short-subunit alcohol dehydrogenase family)